MNASTASLGWPSLRVRMTTASSMPWVGSGKGTNWPVAISVFTALDGTNHT
ncbi:hypothetical protein D3C87_2117660 [compost metagenome]